VNLDTSGRKEINKGGYFTDHGSVWVIGRLINDLTPKKLTSFSLKNVL
jgi:hypothetical protein